MTTNGDKVATSIEPVTYVTPVDDEKYLVDQFENLLHRSVASGRVLLLAVACFAVLSGRYLAHQQPAIC